MEPLDEYEVWVDVEADNERRYFDQLEQAAEVYPTMEEEDHFRGW